jgi:predicted acyltransferase
MSTPIQTEKAQDRVLSVDFFRGFTMFMLVTGVTNIFHELAKNDMGGSVIAFLSMQFEHAEWNGLYAWDLVQPFFMFIVGVAMPFSLAKRMARGDSWKKALLHAFTRSFWLLALGFMLGSDRDSYAFQNVLAQLSFTYIVAFLIMRTDFKIQLAVSFAMIILSDVLYRIWTVDGFNQPFTPDKNFGAWVDMLISGHLSTGHWASFNAIPTTAHTIWGVLVGMLLMKDFSHKKKLLTLLIPGIIAIIAGYLMDPYIPIIKRICTSSFVIVSGGYCLVAMAFSYWLIDVMKYTRTLMFFAIVGMNAIFIYLFSNLGGKNLLSTAADPFISRIFFWMGDVGKNVMVTIAVAAMVWYMCYYLYKKKIFIRL